MIMATNIAESASEDTERRYRAPALEKGLDILELLAREGEVMTTSQIAHKLRRSVSELFRMVLTLEARGYISLVGGREGYGLTNKMFSLGLAQTPTRNLIELALPEMKALAESIGQSCHLTVASNEQIVVVARIESPRDLGFSVRVGYRLPLVESTSGILLVGLLPEKERELALERLAMVAEPKLMENFRQKIQKVRGNRYVESPSDFVEGVIDLSSPIFNTKSIVAALTVPYVRCFPERCGVDQALDHLRTTSGRITDLLQVEA